MLDGQKPTRKVESNYMSSCIHTHTVHPPWTDMTHSVLLWWPHVFFSFPLGLKWHSEWDFEPVSNIPAFQQATIKASIQQDKELKLTHSSKPIISLRARLKILLLTNNMSPWDHFTLVKSPIFHAEDSDAALIKHQKTVSVSTIPFFVFSQASTFPFTCRYHLQMNVAVVLQFFLHSTIVPRDNGVEQVHHYLQNIIVSRRSYYLILQEAWSNFYI